MRLRVVQPGPLTLQLIRRSQPETQPLATNAPPALWRLESFALLLVSQGSIGRHAQSTTLANFINGPE